MAHRYQAFLHRWDHHQPLPHAPDDLARQLLLHTEWLHLVRQDPRLPAQHLPHDWPAIRAQHLFHTLALAYQEPAHTIAESVLDTIPVEDPPTGLTRRTSTGARPGPTPARAAPGRHG
ncbi:PaaX family transcriptional regulator C-terminal domain-containing protein [Saccharothrix stipae]